MVMRMIGRMIACAALAALPASVLVAQDSGPEPQPPTEGAAEADADSADSEILVQGYTEQEVRNFLWRSIESNGRVIARRWGPICVGIDNAPAALTEPVKARIEANLAAFKIPTGAPGCTVNSVVVFHRNAHAFVNWLDKRSDGRAFTTLYLPQKRRLIRPVRPAYAWQYNIDSTAGRGLGELPEPGALPGEMVFGTGPGGRLLASMTPERATNSFAVIDTDALDGLTTDQVGDWLTLQMLVDFRPDHGDWLAPDTILNLFTRAGSNPDAPPEMSKLDRVLLAQIYTEARIFRPAAIRAAAARRALGELEEDGLLRHEGKP
jgi:hypothetical protein